MIVLNEIDSRIDQLLDYLLSIQNKDGGFDRWRIQPNSSEPKRWHLHHKSASYDTAVPLIPLSFMSSEKSDDIVRKGINSIRKSSLDTFLWTWPSPHLVPYCTDDTAICSYVLSKSGHQILNKEFLNECVDQSGYYRFLIWPEKRTKNIPWLTYLRLKWRYRNMKNSVYLTPTGIVTSDSEFTSSCVNLLYLGIMDSNKEVWNRIIQKFRDKELDLLFYMSRFQAVYSYARLAGYGNHPELMRDDNVIAEHLTQLYKDLDEPSPFIKSVLLMNSILFFNMDIDKHANLLSRCIAEIDSGAYTKHTAYYSSRLPTSQNTPEHLYFTCYGSSAYTCSLYLEFLNLYRKNVYGSYYNER